MPAPIAVGPGPKSAPAVIGSLGRAVGAVNGVNVPGAVRGQPRHAPRPRAKRLDTPQTNVKERASDLVGGALFFVRVSAASATDEGGR